MVSSNCWKCLTRPTNQWSTPLLTRYAAPCVAAFSTASALSMPPPKLSEKMKNLKVKGTKTLKIKKKTPVKTGKPPAAGERKALRKRIVLSNTNALEVEGMRDLDAQMIDEMVVPKDGGELSEKTLAAAVLGTGEGELVGQVVGLKGETVDSLRAVDAFKTTQGWGIFRRPGVLVREESVVLTGKLVEAQRRRETVRLVLDGEKGTGKSLMMLHAMATAFVKGWVVVNIPEAQEITNAMTAYSAVPGTNPTLWSQNTYIANWLAQIGKANQIALEKITISREYSSPVPVEGGISLFRLCEVGARDPDVAWPFFQVFWKEITAKGRPPILMCLDSLSFIMQNSLYRAPDYSLIHSHDLAVLRHFTDHLSGAATLPNGGAVIAATNRSHAPLSKSLTLSIKQAEERQAGRPVTAKDPFEKGYDERSEKAMNGVEVMRLKGLSKREARGLMEYWAQSGVLRCKVDEESVSEKWALAGNGVVGEIQRAALWMRI